LARATCAKFHHRHAAAAKIDTLGERRRVTVRSWSPPLTGKFRKNHRRFGPRRIAPKSAGVADPARPFAKCAALVIDCPAMKLRLCTLVAFFTMFSAFASADPLKVGDPAPAVAGTTETGATLNLADAYAKQPYTLVYFFPKADTPGCTKQGCSLRDAYEQLTQQGVAVIGVSADGVAAQQAFKEKFHFPFTLLADPDKKVIEAFGVPTTMGLAKRQAFLIKSGKIVWADYKASTDKQAADVLAVLATQK
jgi:thioredoxin-dependent peroxiredoxin